MQLDTCNEKDKLTGEEDIGELIYRGSVKDIYRSSDNPQVLYFNFSDAYSVFDWGRMPDVLAHKGESLESLASDFFTLLGDKLLWQQFFIRHPALSLWPNHGEARESLCRQGLLHHMLGRFRDPVVEKNYLKVRRVDVTPPSFDAQTGQYRYYPGAYQHRSSSLVPLEIIFRWGTPAGSGLIKRSEDERVLKELGLKRRPVAGEMFGEPVIEFSTKLEPQDRMLTKMEAKHIAALSQQEWNYLCSLVEILAWRLREIFAAIGITLWDGKFEFARIKNLQGDFEFMLVDSIGPDELRLSRGEELLSKEALRTFYRSQPWFQAQLNAKKLAAERGVEDWQDICTRELQSTPPVLPIELKTRTENMYQQLAREVNAYCRFMQKSEVLS